MKQIKNIDCPSKFGLELAKLEREARKEDYRLSMHFEPEQALEDIYKDQRRQERQQQTLRNNRRY